MRVVTGQGLGFRVEGLGWYCRDI